MAEGAENLGGMVVRSEPMQRVLRTIARLGPYKATVLVHGESGTGKELVARALHTLGPVPKGPFVTFNCSNLLETLAESQL
ncbi:MAG: sigma 54-interacting transcriptional regulator, partial [Candidatus Binataceae bacterium]